MKLTSKQVDALMTALTMEKANGRPYNRYSTMSGICRSLERKELMTSFVGAGTTYRGGGSRVRYYRLTQAGFESATALAASQGVS